MKEQSGREFTRPKEIADTEASEEDADPPPTPEPPMPSVLERDPERPAAEPPGPVFNRDTARSLHP